MFYNYNTIAPPPKRKFNSLSDTEIIEIKFGGKTFKAYQVVYGYDVVKASWSGMILTNLPVKELKKSAAGRTNELSIKAQNHKGLWKLVLPQTNLSQLDYNLVWFTNPTSETVHILKKPSEVGRW